MTALDDFVIATAKNYLQSIVFVDDDIYDGQLLRDHLAASIGSFGGLKSQFADERLSGEVNVVGNEGNVAVKEVLEKPEPCTRDLMESFARYGIVCALYEPQEGFKTDSQSALFLLCERADVVILDWDLHNDNGEGVSSLIAGLIKKSEDDLPHHVRLCTLYTGRPSLYPVMQQLLDKLEHHGCLVEVVPEKLQLHSGATRISVFGKPHIAGRPAPDLPYEVEEKDLADRVITEFANLHHGLMPAYALHGLASVRRNTKRLLDKFHDELDGAFLLHRALLLGDHDAFDELPDLLSDEILAVLEDTRLDSAVIKQVASAAIVELAITNNDNLAILTDLNEAPLEYAPILRGLLAGGEKPFRAAMKNSNRKDELGEKGGFRGISGPLLSDFGEMLKADDGSSTAEKLAALYCNRTQYGEDRKLSFGTVVRHKNNEDEGWKYSVCLMPVCDTQRLCKPWNFPFWHLKPDAKNANVGKRSGVVVVDPEGNSRCLSAGGKIRGMLWLQEFAPGPNRTVVATRNGNCFRFAVAGMIIEWVAELKPLHAQRIAAHMGTEVSRVGLVESEWLRLFCDR